MECAECKTTNSNEHRYCWKCGAELGRTLDETVQKGFRDRKAVEMEITETVVERLLKWAGYLWKTVAFIGFLFAVMLGLSYRDVRKSVDSGKAEISDSVREGKNEIGLVRQDISGLKAQTQALQSDVDRYRKVDQKIEELQNSLSKVKGEVLDLSNRTVRVKTLKTTGPGPGFVAFSGIGCQSLDVDKDYKVAYCIEGSPPVLFQLTPDGELRPVSSLSPKGFQDTSSSPKPPCDSHGRGTLYVEKGGVNGADQPFLCAKKSDNTYEWMRLGIAH